MKNYIIIVSVLFLLLGVASCDMSFFGTDPVDPVDPNTIYPVIELVAIGPYNVYTFSATHEDLHGTFTFRDVSSWENILVHGSYATGILSFFEGHTMTLTVLWISSGQIHEMTLHSYYLDVSTQYSTSYGWDRMWVVTEHIIDMNFPELGLLGYKEFRVFDENGHNYYTLVNEDL